MNVHFLIIGDMGSGNKHQMEVSKSMLHLLKKYPIKFICGLGDNIYEDGVTTIQDKKFQTHYEIPYQKIPNTIKMYMCLGNHDCHISYNPLKQGFLKNNSEIQVQYGILSQKLGKKWFLPSNYYTFTKGNIDFFVLDTNFDILSPEEIEKQRQFMKNKIRSSKQKWKIIYGHHTWLSPGGHGNADQKLDEFLTDLCSEKRIHMYMCGHDHIKSFIKKQIQKKPTYLVICGTGGKVYHREFTPENIYRDNSDLEFFSPNLGVAYLKSSKDKLTIQFYNETNQLEHTGIIS